jgi:hypothetical protein
MIVQHLHHNQAIAAGAVIPAGEEDNAGGLAFSQ